MAEEIEWLDEELVNLTQEIGERIKEITSAAGKKLGKSAREERVRACLFLPRACVLASAAPPQARAQRQPGHPR